MEATTTPTHKTCECGCGEIVKSRFLPGHDAKLKSDLCERTLSADWWVRDAAITQLVNEGWAHFIPDAALVIAKVRSRGTNGRFVDTRHIDSVSVANIDTEDTTHSHRACPDIVGNTRKADVSDGWACTTCIHTADHADHAATKAQFVWAIKEGEVRDID